MVGLSDLRSEIVEGDSIALAVADFPGDVQRLLVMVNRFLIVVQSVITNAYVLIGSMKLLSANLKASVIYL